MNSHRRGKSWIVFSITVLIVLAVAGGATAHYVQHVRDMTRHVVLDDDGYRVEIDTFDNTVNELLNRYEIVLGPGDEIEPGLDAALDKETHIRITRAMAVTVKADGEKKVIHLTGGTVQKALDMAGVKLREDDIVNYGLNEPLVPQAVIEVTRMDQEIIIETEAIPYQVIAKQNESLDEGVDKVIQEGEQGELQRKILIVYRDGKEIERSLKEETVVKEPVDRIVEKGTGKHFTNSRGLVVRYKDKRKMSATAYSAGFASTGKRPGDPYYGITSSGKKVKPHHTIAAPPEIPFGTKVYIPELILFWRARGVEIDGIFTVEDRGSAIKGNKIDVYFEDENMAKIWGRRSVTVYFLR
jgi:uncharacterized protein YabE (DUF348 family)